MNDTVTDTMLVPDGQYTVLRKDRTDHRGGGVCALVSKKYNCRHISLSVTCGELCNESCCDILHFEIVLRHDKFRMIFIYRLPNSCNKFETTLHQTSALDKLLTELVDPHLLYSTIILGDFNLPSIDWPNSFTKIDGIHDTIFNCMSSLGMHQIVTQPTRITNTSQTSILDLIFTNDPLLTRQPCWTISSRGSVELIASSSKFISST